MVKERRCNLFDDNGKPRRMKDGTMGCFRDASVCHFAHPHEREWKAAHPSFPPKHDSVVDSDSDFYYTLIHSDRLKDNRDREKEKERERDRDRDKDRTGGRKREKEKERKPSSSFHLESPHRRESTTTRASPGPSRRSTFDSTMDVGGTTKRGKSPALSTSSDQLERPRKDNKYRTKEPPPLDRYSAQKKQTISRRSRSRSRDKGRDRERADLPSKTPPAGSHVADPRNTDISIAQHFSALPPEPPKPPPLQPPPPAPPRIPEVPKAPSFVSNQQPAGSAETASRGLNELSMDEQRSAWHERIDLMFTSITSRRDYTKLESDLSQIRLLSNSSVVNNMPEADRAHMNAQKITLELQMEVKRKEINETIQKLIGSCFWPVLRVSQISEMEKTLGETKKHVLEVRSLLDDVNSSYAALFKTSASDWTQDSDRPTKRRKLEGGADTLGQSTDENAEVMIAETAMELEAFRDKLTELHRHLIDLENDITQRDEIVSGEIELHIDARLEEEVALYPPVMEPKEVSLAEIEAVVDAKNQELVHAVTTTGEEIGVLAVEVAELITKVNALEVRCMALEAENQEFKNKLAQDTLKHATSQDVLVRRDKEIDAIAAALQAYISQAPTGQTVGDLPSAESIIESLDSELDGHFREKFRTTLVNIQQQVFDKVQESHNRTLDTVSPKIMLLLRMVNLITARLGKPDMDAANTG